MAALTAIREVALAQARELARRGRLAEAGELLDEAYHDTEPDTAYLDLRARVHAQQGDLARADECWAQAQRLSPENTEYAAARRRIARMRTGRRLPPILAAGIAGLLVGAVVTALLTGGDDEKPPAAATAAPSAPAPSLASAEDVLTGLDVTMPGVRARRTPGEITVTFDRGLFAGDTTLTRDGRALLARLADRLKPQAGRLRLTVLGHTDDQPLRAGGPYAGNMELAEARAATVREVLHERAAVPTAAVTVSALGPAVPPNRGRAARTVSIRISAV
ncbi:OmpA family protein [Actinomadura hibisca]|uniref:OmpA family protein n=1 Tax=Actinomadura hibisca TaxID=68565 RepID=UPI000834E6AE|nr:OmpA family protein [Actinomadura hibisca]